MPSGDTRPARTGRPAGQGSIELDQAILRTAEKLFIERGYAAASMDQIAAAAGTGKQTIYRRYASKEALFEAVIWAVTAKLYAAVTVPERVAGDPLATLREASRALLDFVCDPDVIAMYRVLIAEAERFPGVFDDALRGSREQHEVYLRPMVQAAQDAGAIGRGVPAETLGNILSGLMTGWVVHQGLLGESKLAGRGERRAFFEVAWSVFLRGAS